MNAGDRLPTDVASARRHTIGDLLYRTAARDMIKTGGENVASREVEEALFAHPDVAEVAVFGISHPYWVEAVTAAVVLRPGATTAPLELIAEARTRLAG